jgi:hypothetical protein
MQGERRIGRRDELEDAGQSEGIERENAQIGEKRGEEDESKHEIMRRAREGIGEDKKNYDVNGK